MCNRKKQEYLQKFTNKKLINPYHHHHLIILSEDTFKVRRKGASRDNCNQRRIRGTEAGGYPKAGKKSGCWSYDSHQKKKFTHSQTITCSTFPCLWTPQLETTAHFLPNRFLLQTLTTTTNQLSGLYGLLTTPRNKILTRKSWSTQCTASPIVSIQLPRSSAGSLPILTFNFRNCQFTVKRNVFSADFGVPLNLIHFCFLLMVIVLSGNTSILLKPPARLLWGRVTHLESCCMVNMVLPTRLSLLYCWMSAIHSSHWAMISTLFK